MIFGNIIAPSYVALHHPNVYKRTEYTMQSMQQLQYQVISLNNVGAMQLLLWLLSSMYFSVGTTYRLCDRIYFNPGDTTKMPYVQLEGIYYRFTNHNGYPIYKHEQRNYYFEYLDANDENIMVFSIYIASKPRRSYMGVRATMTHNFKSPNWVQQITDSIQPFQKFIIKWEYYDWQSQTHISITRDAVSLICVPDDVYRCSSQRVYFNTTFTNSQSGVVLQNHLEDYFQELTGGYNDYKNFRKKYRHSRNSDWILYYESPYWKIKNDRSSFNTPFLRAKDCSFIPEYIQTPWQYLDGSWRNFSLSVGIGCRGLVQYHKNGSAKSCKDSNPCFNGGFCANSKVANETVCRCRAPFTGLRCEKIQKRCSTFLYNKTMVKHVVVNEFESSSFASVFCKENYKPQHFISQCVTGKYSPFWTQNRGCYSSQTNVPHSRVRRENKESPFKFDDYPELRLILPAAVCGFQLLVTFTHVVIVSCRKDNVCRILSAHAFISFVCWALYSLGCTIVNCPKYGKIFNDFIKISFVVTPLSYIAMLLESICSAERQYISALSPDVTVIDFIERLKKTDPERSMTIYCYHWETRTRYVRSSDGELQAETYEERVDTYTESRIFPISFSQDISDPEGLNIDLFRVTRLKLKSEIECGDEETMMKFSEMSQQMIDENKHRDQCINFTYFDAISGFRKRICAYTDPKYRLCWMNLCTYWVFSFLGLTWVFRIIFKCKTAKCEYTIKKLIYYARRCDNSETAVPNLQGTSNAGFSASLQHIDTVQGSSPCVVQDSCPTTVQVSVTMKPQAKLSCQPPAYEDVVKQYANMIQNNETTD